jgi:hypothetical protein
MPETCRVIDRVLEIKVNMQSHLGYIYTYRNTMHGTMNLKFSWSYVCFKGVTVTLIYRRFIVLAELCIGLHKRLLTADFNFVLAVQVLMFGYKRVIKQLPTDVLVCPNI